MPLLKPIETRRAFRAIAEAPIGEDVLEELASAAHLAPSSANNQPWRLVTVVDPSRLEALRSTFTPGNYWAKKAPAVTAFVTSADWSLRAAGKDYAWFELGMAAMAYQLQAAADGLYAHPIAGFDAEAVKKILGIPEAATLVVLVVLGYPGDASHLSEKHLASERAPRARKSLGEVFAFDSWNPGLLPAPKA